MLFRDYLVTVVVIALLLWGPIDHSWPFWFIIRLSYLVLIPVLIWFLVGWVWSNWQFGVKMENTLIKVLSGFNCVVLLILAFIEANSKTHIENTNWVQTRDGMEAVGDDIRVQGPDWGNVCLLVILIAFVFWFGVLKKNVQDSDYKKS